MYGLLILVEIIVSLLLIIVILMQSSKGGGLAGSFGGGNAGTVFGVRRTADFLSKTTAILAGIFLVLALVINIFVLGSDTGSVESVIQRGKPTSVPTATTPRTNAPAQQQEQPQQQPQK